MRNDAMAHLRTVRLHLKLIMAASSNDIANSTYRGQFLISRQEQDEDYRRGISS